MKFGATENAHLTWATNVLAPAQFCQRYRHARIVGFSTGNVYGFTPVARGGALETDPLHPVGEYSWSAVGRERSYEYAARSLGIPMVILRLNYAVEMRYGVLVDIAQRVLTGETVDVTMGQLNAIWQGDANAMALAAFAQLAQPPRILNLSGPETLSVRRVAEEFGRLFGKPAQVTGEESASAFLTNAQESHRLFGYPEVSAQRMVRWIADWLRRGLATWGKPTHFQVRDGRY
jgi:nucleoside-diphosphate-sugar epimerase